ncbi:hypothetical protein ACIQAC_30330 [Streptomyces sp. NPDC088387]|uniref:hypothetical protein n=1 Tax=Streptomyces sp. NPDC088387 TaxID=3365859 RepID=UPI003822EA82
MPQPRMPLNRTSLAVVGLVFLVGGCWLAVTHASWAPQLPTWWPTPGTHSTIVDAGRLAEVRSEGWWTPTAMAGTITLTVLPALWCLHQLPSGFHSRTALPAPDSSLRTRALEDAMTEQLVALGGVARCRTRVLTRSRRLHVRLHVWLQPDVTPAEVLPALTTLAAHTQTALTPYRVHTHVRFSTRAHRRPQLR